MNERARRAARGSLVGLASAAALGLLCQVSLVGQVTGAAATRSTLDGVYTSQQADRGEREYGRSCEHCHGRELEGDRAREVPPLLGDPFMRSWTGRPLKTLLDQVSQAMPADRRGALSARTYTDLIAFLLRANGFPSGDTALPPAADFQKDGLESLAIAALPSSLGTSAGQ
jgi:cytochrome c